MRRSVPSHLDDLPAIDDRARDGKFRLVGDDAKFAVGRWSNNAWVFPNGQPIGFEPDRYQP